MNTLPNGAPRDFIYTPPNTPLDIVHQDDHILVLDKPSGLLTVPGKTEDLADCLEARALQQFATARTIHRLDKDTSGLIVLGLTPEAHANIGLQFEKRQTTKSYIALVWGKVEHASGTVDQPLHTDWPNRPKQHIDLEKGRAAITDWQLIETTATHSRLRLMPHTGRTHQLRVHMAHLGHPILGDNLYAPSKALEAAPRLCLHATKLGFTHPHTGDVLKFESSCPF